MSTNKLALPGMEAYLDEEEVVFSSPITRRHADTTTNTKDKPATHKSPQRPTSKLWTLGKQTQDEERVFKFEEEESPAKHGAHRETRGKKTKSRVYSRWDYSSPSSSDSDRQTTSDDEDNNKENVGAPNIKELIEIEQKLAKIKLEKEQESSTRLVVVVDTNCLINAKQREAILALKHYTQLLFIIPFVVLQELDKLKTGDDNKGYDARQAVQFLNTEISRDKIWIRGQCQNELPLNPELANEEEPGNSPHDVLLVTLDRVLQVKAKSHNISSVDGTTLRAKLDDSWHETTRVATGIFFKDGKLCARASSPAQQRSVRTSAVASSAQLRVRASVMHAASTNAAAANAPCREQVIALSSAHGARAIPGTRKDDNYANSKRIYMR